MQLLHTGIYMGQRESRRERSGSRHRRHRSRRKHSDPGSSRYSRHRSYSR